VGEARSADVVIVGGGVIGCSIAYFLARQGASVTLLERDGLAAGASGVAAGMLAPQVEAPFADEFFEVALRGREQHATVAEELSQEVGLDVEYRKTGILRVARTEAERVDLQRMLRWQAARGLAAEWIEIEHLGDCEPLLRGVAGRLLAGGLWLEDEAQVRGPRLVQALATAAIQRGAHFLEATAATELIITNGRATGVRTPNGAVSADVVVLAAGVWTPNLLQLPVAPVKGQILSLRALGRAPKQVLWCGECYLVPRPDGEIVLGATEEEGNHDARPTVGGLNRLTEAALEVVPAVGGFAVAGFWAGLRPAAPDRFPIIGWAQHVERLFVATAHYRNGILLGPLTGLRVADCLLSGASLQEFAPFGPQRFQSESSEATMRSAAWPSP
jgi:glycine oxidase